MSSSINRVITAEKQGILGFVSTTVWHKKGKENSNAEALSQSTHLAEALPLEEDEYFEFYEVDEPVIRFDGGLNKIQHVQHSTVEIAEEQAKVICWI